MGQGPNPLHLQCTLVGWRGRWPGGHGSMPGGCRAAASARVVVLGERRLFDGAAVHKLHASLSLCHNQKHPSNRLGTDDPYGPPGRIVLSAGSPVVKPKIEAVNQGFLHNEDLETKEST